MGGNFIHLLSIGSNTGKGLTRPRVLLFMDPSQPASSASGLPSSSSREEPRWVVETARRLDEARAKMRAMKKLKRAALYCSASAWHRFTFWGSNDSAPRDNAASNCAWWRFGAAKSLCCAPQAHYVCPWQTLPSASLSGFLNYASLLCVCLFVLANYHCSSFIAHACSR